MKEANQNGTLKPSASTPLLVVLDLRDPFSYLALAPARALGIEKNALIDWIPARGHTLVSPTEPDASDDRGILHRRARAKMIAREIAVYAEAQSLEISQPYRDGPADAAYGAWLWLRENRPERLAGFLDALFKAYWAAELDPANTDHVASLLDEDSTGRAEFERWQTEHGDTALRSIESELHESGISQAPAYLLEDEVFYGRQHLPMIRWILESRPGDGPA